MIPSPADLTYFVEIAHTRNLSRASERLGISQPSLSLAMRRLEESVGTLLLARSKRGVILTQAGQQLLAHAKFLLQTWDHVKGRALASVHEIQGHYTIGCHPSVALDSLSGFLPQLMAAHPGLEISLRHDISRKIAEDVISWKVDVGIVVNPVRHPDLVIHTLCRDDVTLWTRHAGASDAQNPSRGRAVLICDPDLRQSQTLMRQLERRAIKFNRMIFSSNLEVIADLTASGCGIGILPAMVAARARKKLKRVANAPVFHDEHCVLFRIENKGVKAVQALSQAIRASISKD